VPLHGNAIDPTMISASHCTSLLLRVLRHRIQAASAVGPSATFASRPLLKQDRTNRRAAGLAATRIAFQGAGWSNSAGSRLSGLSADKRRGVRIAIVSTPLSCTHSA
jgi:hypothetical protein